MDGRFMLEFRRCCVCGTGTEINPHFWKPGDKNWCQGGESSRNSPCDSATGASRKRNWRRCPRCCYKKKRGEWPLSGTRKSGVVQSKEIKAMREITLQSCSGSIPGKKDLHQIMMITKISKSELAVSNFRLEINKGFLITRIILEELSVEQNPRFWQ